jgi:ABC-type nitrate/sulfonate/bicarbonate transport system ATPase subunit
MNWSISVNDVVFGYGGEIVLKEVSLAITKGEFVSVIGPSGCGKSTLLRLIAGLIFPNEGSVSVDGKTVSGPGLDRAVVFQDYSLFPWMTCIENVTLALEQAQLGRTNAERMHIAEKYLELVGLMGEGKKLPGELSGGMRQRSAIARALAQNAPILLMDEPFGALDEITRAKQQDALLELWQGSSDGTGKTVLFVTHDVEEALILGDRVIVMGSHPGRIAFELKIALTRPRSHNSALRHPKFVELRNILLDKLDSLVEIERQVVELDGSGI